MENKIYCKNCKYYKGEYAKKCKVGYYHLFFTTFVLNHKGQKLREWKNKEAYKKMFPKGDENSGVSDRCEANKEFNCPFYERKWYKFFAKPKKGPKHLLVELLKENED